MNLIDKQLEKIKREQKLGLMTHLVIGYPSLTETIKIAKTMTQAGADFIELQIPFSDPLADGPTIMRACEKALENGVKVADAFKLADKLSKQINIPLLFMAYYNTVFKYGAERFYQDAKKAAVSGLIVPDIPLEEEREEHFIKYCQQEELKNIRVISPVSTPERLQKNARVASGFVYCAARQGITGARKQLDPAVASFLQRIREVFNIPIAVGFGISQKKHFKQLTGHADIAVIGSAIIDIINKSDKNTMEKNVKHFLNSLIR